MKIEIKDHVASVVTSIGQITRNDTILEVNGTSALVAKTLEFCIEKGKFGKIDTHIPFAMTHKQADAVKSIVEKIRSKPAYKFIDFKNPASGQIGNKREWDYCDLFVTENSINELEKYSIRRDDPILDTLGQFYMSEFLDYVKLDKLKLI